jgi:multidrug efflux system outer membrane protein
MKRTVLLILFSTLFSGCLVGPKFSKPTANYPASYRFSEEGKTDSITTLKWSELYQDTVLQSLIQKALKENKDMLIAMSKISQARAMAGYSKADLFPSLGYAGKVGHMDLSNNNANEIGGGAPRDILYGMGTLSWELDLWGKVRHSNRAAVADLMAMEENQRAITTSLIAEVASMYFQLRGLDERLQIAQRTVTFRQQSLDLITLRFKGGEVGELDKFQAEAQLSIAETLVPSFQRQIGQTENALSLLIGVAPSTIHRGLANSAQQFPLSIPAGIPSSLLRRRPDVRQAEQAWIAQNERIGVAQAQRFPSISLTGFLGLGSQDLNTILSSDAGMWYLAGSLTGPLFNFGKNKKRVQIEKAKTEQVKLQYEKAVLTAFADVENALVSVETYKREFQARTRQLDASTGTSRLSRARYNEGYTNFLEVLDSERTLLDTELQASQTLEQQLRATVLLYKALGGGW